MKHLAILFVFSVMGSCLPVYEISRGFTQKAGIMTARGTFDVKVTPQPADDSADGPFSRLLIEKQFHGAVEAVSKGQMLGTTGPDQGSGAYVALEHVIGTLDGKQGSFILLHKGTMIKGVPSIDISVVPDSGTGQLDGIKGKMTIVIEAGKHSYEFEYSLDGVEQQIQKTMP